MVRECSCLAGNRFAESSSLFSQATFKVQIWPCRCVGSRVDEKVAALYLVAFVFSLRSVMDLQRAALDRRSCATVSLPRCLFWKPALELMVRWQIGLCAKLNARPTTALYPYKLGIPNVMTILRAPSAHCFREVTDQASEISTCISMCDAHTVMDLVRALLNE